MEQIWTKKIENQFSSEFHAQLRLNAKQNNEKYIQGKHKKECEKKGNISDQAQAFMSKVL